MRLNRMYRRPELKIKWQNLSHTDYQVTSLKSEEYNCFAWAAGEDDRWWQPIPGEQFYWPDGVPQEETLEAIFWLIKRWDMKFVMATH